MKQPQDRFRLMKQPQNDHAILGIFPSPIYITNRDSVVEEEKEIEDVIKEEKMLQTGSLDSHTINTYIFDTKLKNLKEFCEEHIKVYVKEVINPKEELDFYITQSWINVVKPGGNIMSHWHSNSIISGTFYPTTIESDTIRFYDPYWTFKQNMEIETKEYNKWNCSSSFFLAEKNNLMLFPSWLNHSVEPNEKATTDRISISFNVFAKGNFGIKGTLNELIL